MNLIKSLLEEQLRPDRVMTDLSSARTPSFAIACRSHKLLDEDVAGMRRWRGSYALNMRSAAVDEHDRQNAYNRLETVAQGLEGMQGRLPLCCGNTTVTAIASEPPAFCEAYDDGTACWTLAIKMDYQN